MAAVSKPKAELVIPHEWLVPNLTIDSVKALQGTDAQCAIEKGDLHLQGAEVLVARNWVQEEFWPRIQDAIEVGYAAEKTYTFMRVQAERRGQRRATD